MYDPNKSISGLKQNKQDIESAIKTSQMQTRVAERALEDPIFVEKVKPDQQKEYKKRLRELIDYHKVRLEGLQRALIEEWSDDAVTNLVENGYNRGSFPLSRGTRRTS